MKFTKELILSLLLAGLIGGGAFFAAYQQVAGPKTRDLQSEVLSLQGSVKDLQDKLGSLTGAQQKTAVSVSELQNRQVVAQKSQDQLLTAAVAKVTSSVVSVVISKDVPKLEVVYENPFGNDPFFKDFNIQVPVYQQKGTQREQVGAATGFFITTDGYILTNKHVVSDPQADYVVLLSNGQQKPAKVVYIDPNNDVAIMKVDGTGYPAVSLGNSAGLQLGQTVAAIGNALGEYNNSVSVGIISGLNRTIQASGNDGATETLSGVLQTDAAINPGNSGGPLLDLNGNVVGLNVATVVGSNNISFSIPINSVKSIIKSAIGR